MPTTQPTRASKLTLGGAVIAGEHRFSKRLEDADRSRDAHARVKRGPSAAAASTARSTGTPCPTMT